MVYKKIIKNGSQKKKKIIAILTHLIFPIKPK